jgi:DnaJ-class molecular chaperone
MIQQMQSACNACGGQGKSFKRKQEREVLEVHIQKGSPDGHKLTFNEMADEHPEADAGDVIFVCKEQPHAVFKRKGADLYMEKTIALSEALCGFELEIEHLDGRKLLVKTTAGDIVRPMLQGFDPLEDKGGKMEWDKFEDSDCPSVDNVAQAEITDEAKLKDACEGQLKRQGVDVSCFVVDSSSATFKTGSREEIMAAKKTKKGSTMYVLKDPNEANPLRVMKAVKGEGMPTYKNPFVHGNLFLILTIEFPSSLTEEAQNALRKLLPAELNKPTWSADDQTVEVHQVVDTDPVQSYNENKHNMQTGGADAYDEDEGGGGGGMRGPGGAQCQQM